MKGFLDKTWAKAAAFVLTLVFGVLTVLGGVGVGILISYDVFLDGGDFLRQTMYEGNCVRSIDTADSFLRGTLANAGVLVSDGTYDYSTVENGDVTEEERAQVISDLPRVFAEEFSRDAADCHLTVTVRGNGEVVGTFENFELTDGDKPLYATQETFTYALNTGNTAMVTIAADLLRTEEAPSYSYLLDMWLVEHTALTVILTVLFAALALFFFCFLMASAGHWAGHEGISDVAGQDPRGCMADRTAVYVFHWLGSVLLRVGTRFLLRGAGAAGAAVPVRLCRPVQGGHRPAERADRADSPVPLAHCPFAVSGAVAHRQKPAADLEDSFGGADTGVY